MNNKSAEYRVDRRIVPILVIASLVGGILYALIAGLAGLLVPALSIIVPAVAGSTFLLARRSFSIESPEFRIPNLNKVFAMLFMLSVVVLAVSGARVVLYFVIMSLMYLLVFLEVSGGHASPRSPLLKMVALVANLSWSVVVKYPIYFGGTDTFGHIRYASMINATGHTIPVGLDPAYAFFPLYHVMASSLSTVTSIDPKLALFLICATISALFGVFMFEIVRLITGRVHLALYASFFVNVSPIFIYYSYYPVPRAAAFLFFVILLYAFMKEKNPKNWLSTRILVLIFSGAIVLIHSATIIQLTIPLIGIALLDRRFGGGLNIQWKSLSLLLVLTVSYWLIVATTFSKSLFGYLLLAPEISQSRLEVGSIDLLAFFKDHLATGFFLFFIVIGIGRASKIHRELTAFSAISIPLLLFYVPNPVKESQLLLVHLGFYRFELFAEFFVSIMVAIGFAVVISTTLRIRRTQWRRIATGLLFAIMLMSIFFSMTTSTNAPDVNSHSSARFFRPVDMATLKFVEESSRFNASISSDYFVAEYFYTQRYFIGIEDTNMRAFDSRMIDIHYADDPGGFVILRIEEFRSSGTLVLGSFSDTYDYPFSVEHETELVSRYASFSKVFDNGANEVFDH
jgi:hypothetical protein